VKVDTLKGADGPLDHVGAAASEHPTALVSGLAYLEVTSTTVEHWRVFGGDVLGMPLVEADGGELWLRMDQRPWRIRVVPSDHDGVRAIGWQGRSLRHLEELRARLLHGGFQVDDLDAEACASRSVTRGFAFVDSLGIRHEVVLEAPSGGDERAAPATPFVTGELGMGHIVFYVDDVAAADALYMEAFGMSLRENIQTQVGVGGHFYGCNPRHHTVAVVDTGHRPAVMHVMVEMPDVDDVGTAQDRARRLGWTPRTDLGRHRTDHMLSFYVPGPAGFDFEVGTGGLWVDDATWEAQRDSSRRRAWGHVGLESQGRD
jgi:2,3-dihydroxybiphenyl 1,2-dioxygenase